MPRYRQLLLFPGLPPVGRPDPDAEAMSCRAGVEYYDLTIRDILNRNSNRRLPFAWTINPYRGCELGCAYCYARYTHGFFDLNDWEDFETKIYVKRGAAESLKRFLKRVEAKREPIAIGTATDPYQPAEHKNRVTRSLLEVFRRCSGLVLSITTKSPLILRDLDLLAELKELHDLKVHVTITTVDSCLARKLEPYAPDPRARLRTVSKLALEGIPTSIFCMPVMPGINDGEGVLRPLFHAARESRAEDVIPNTLFLRPAARARFFPWLEEEFPELLPRYQALYGKNDYLPKAEAKRILSIFEMLHEKSGFRRGIKG
jgi:DNA repair photolyase